MVKKTGEMVISLDTEIAWGWLSFLNQREKFYPLFAETPRVIKRLLDLFDKYDFPVTWAIVGRLLEKETEPRLYKRGLNELFPSIPQDTSLNELPTSFLKFQDLVTEITSRTTGHELASHTYNHLFTNNLTNNPAAFVEDVIAMEKLFNNRLRTGLTSLIFPKNQVGFLKELSEHSSIKIYRAPDTYWFSRFPTIIQKIIRQIDGFIVVAPKVFEVKKDDFGLNYIEGSLLFRKSHLGIKKYYPINVIQKKAIRGIDAAIAQHKTFHLWFHPFNFAFQEKAHFDALETVLEYANKQRAKGLLKIKTMNQLTLTNGR